MASTWLTVKCLSEYQTPSHSPDRLLMKGVFDSINPFVHTPEGAETQRRLWEELVEKLDRVQPGVMDSI